MGQNQRLSQFRPVHVVSWITGLFNIIEHTSCVQLCLYVSSQHNSIKKENKSETKVTVDVPKDHVKPNCSTDILGLFFSTKKLSSSLIIFLLTHYHFRSNVYIFVCLTKRKLLESLHSLMSFD